MLNLPAKHNKQTWHYQQYLASRDQHTGTERPQQKAYGTECSSCDGLVASHLQANSPGRSSFRNSAGTTESVMLPIAAEHQRLRHRAQMCWKSTSRGPLHGLDADDDCFLVDNSQRQQKQRSSFGRLWHFEGTKAFIRLKRISSRVPLC